MMNVDIYSIEERLNDMKKEINECLAGTKVVMNHSERQKFLKTSGLAKLFGVNHLLPKVEEISKYEE